jgi:type VI secretion system secreted protein Hcp
VPNENPPTQGSGQSGQVDMFLKITGNKQGVIKGESSDHKHGGEIDIYSYSWGIIQPVSQHGGLSTGKREHKQFRFVMRSQSATPQLLQAVSTGEHLKEVVLTCRKAGTQQQEYMKWKLTNAFIAEIKTGYLVPGDIIPHDEVALVFQKVELEYKNQKADGTLGAAIVYMDDFQTHV